MFCPFIKGECRKDCVFHHTARAVTGGMTSPVSSCILAIAAEQLDHYTMMRVLKMEDQNS